MLAVTLLIAALSAVMLALMYPGAVRAKLPYLARAGVVAVLVFAALSA